MGLMFARRRAEEKKARQEKQAEPVSAAPAEDTLDVQETSEDDVSEQPAAEPLMLERPKHAAKIEKAKDQQRRAMARDGD